MPNSFVDPPLKSKIQELLTSAGIEKTACYNNMLDYTIEIFESQGLLCLHQLGRKKYRD
jgi:hypothetical protein